MKVSVSLPDEDVEFLDAYAEAQGFPSRSAALHKAVRLLRASELGPSYEQAWDDWLAGDDADLWESTTSDGLGS